MLTGSTSRQAIRDAIEASGKTHEQVVVALDVSPVTLTRRRNGHSDPKFARLDQLAAALGRPIRLTFGDDEKSAPAWAEALADETARKVISALSPERMVTLQDGLARLEALLLRSDGGTVGQPGAQDPGAPGPLGRPTG